MRGRRLASLHRRAWPPRPAALLPVALLLAALLAGVRCGRALAAQPAPSPGEVVVEGGEEVVRPRPGPEPAPTQSDRYQAGAHTVITRDQFTATQKTVADVLEAVPGVALTRSGDALAPTKVSIRGSRPDQVLVIVDGVPLADVTDNAAQGRREGRQGVDLAAIPLERVQSIEIVRGAAASLYGPGAVAGAIVIHLRRPRRRQVVVAGTVGSGGYREADGQWDEPLGHSAVSVHLNHRQTDGVYVYYDPAAATATTTTPGAADRCAEPLGDGYYRRRCNSKQVTTLDLAWQSGKHRRVALQLEQYRRQGLGGVADARPFGREARDRMLLSYADAHSLAAPGQPGAQLGWRASAQHLDDRTSDNTTLGGEALTGHFSDDRADGDLWWERWYGRHQVRAGASLGHQALDDRYFNATRDKSAVYGAWSYHPDSGTVEASLRRDDLSHLAPETTWRAAFSSTVWGGLGLKGSRATGYRPPSLYELFDPGAPGGVSAANPDLRPETSVSTDGGLFYQDGRRLYAEALAFRQDVRNDIVAVADPSNPNLFRLENVSRTRSTGLELTLNLQPGGGWRLDGSYTGTDARIRDNDALDPRDNGNRVPGVPDVRWRLALAWRREGWQASLSTRYSGRRYVDTANTRYLAAYQLYDAALTMPLGRGFELGLEGRNLTGQTYVELENQPPPGREWFLTLRWRLAPEAGSNRAAGGGTEAAGAAGIGGTGTVAPVGPPPIGPSP